VLDRASTVFYSLSLADREGEKKRIEGGEERTENEFSHLRRDLVVSSLSLGEKK